LLGDDPNLGTDDARIDYIELTTIRHKFSLSISKRDDESKVFEV